jgi:transcriptional regulator with XRE-family HTH domain
MRSLHCGLKVGNTVARGLERKTIREWRHARFLTQSELGEMVGVTYFTIINWELGIKQPRARNMRALAAALGIKPEQIILIEGKRTPRQSDFAQDGE